jgi:hypothetical protein
MIKILGYMARGLRKFSWSEKGSSTIEFVILFPPFIIFFLSGVEAGLMMLRNAMLERGLDLAVREIRIGTPVPPTFAQFRQQICDVAIVIPNCMQNLQVELQVVDGQTWEPLDPTPRCVDRNSPIDPFQDPDQFYNVGQNNNFMLVRLCANVDPILPGFALGLVLDRVPLPGAGDVGDGENDLNGYGIVAVSAFVNEPSRGS